VIVASADIQTFTRDLALEHGAVSFITKPFSAEPVLAAVQAALASATGGAK
jgi:DNA-binding response OmpR family regulator